MLLYARSLPDAPLYGIDGVSRYAFHALRLSGAALLLWTPWDLLEEERRLARTFGEAYREYQRRVPRFLPLPRRRRIIYEHRKGPKGG